MLSAVKIFGDFPDVAMWGRTGITGCKGECGDAGIVTQGCSINDTCDDILIPQSPAWNEWAHSV